MCPTTLYHVHTTKPYIVRNQGWYNYSYMYYVLMIDSDADEKIKSS